MRKTKRVGSRVSVANSRNCARTAHRRFCLLDLLEGDRLHAGWNHPRQHSVLDCHDRVGDRLVRDLGDRTQDEGPACPTRGNPRKPNIGGCLVAERRPRGQRIGQKPADSQSSERRLVGVWRFSLLRSRQIAETLDYERARPVTGGNVRVAACSDGRRRRVATACSSARRALRRRPFEPLISI
jgi:hypothetical protein